MLHEKCILHTLICVILFSFPHLVESSPVVKPDLYQEGIAQRDSGNWQKALNIWLAAKDSTQESSKIDPRIGIAFIELVTQKQATDYYRQASDMYFWGFRQEDLTKHQKVVEEEIRRISPLLTEKESKNWLKLLDKGDTKLNEKIKGFWIKKDPIPTSEINERLIEHWERIAHVKNRYTKGEATIYGTDDRGLVFVKYGAPDRQFEGKLGLDLLEIMRWFGDDFVLRQEIQRFNPTPEIEIWLYQGLLPNEAAIFLFGKKEGYGEYGLRYGIEELIPERAFRRRNTRGETEGILPGAILQLMYYRELIGVDDFYLNRFRELEALWVNARASGRLSPNYHVIKGLLSHYKSIDKPKAQFEYLPTDKTDALEGLEALDLKYEQFRHLDKQNNSMLYLIAVATSLNYGDLNYTSFFREARKSKYKQRHVLVAYDDNWSLRSRLIGYPALKNTNTSTFDIAQNISPTNYTLVVEKTLLDERRTDLQESEIPDTASVIGIGSQFLGEIAPLDTDTTQFEMSDVILGVAKPSHVAKSQFPFPVVPKDPVQTSDSLKMYFEAYHLTAPILVEYRIEEKKEGEDGRAVLTGRVKLSGSSANVIDLDVRSLAPDDYILKCSVTSRKTGEMKTRSVGFRVIG